MYSQDTRYKIQDSRASQIARIRKLVHRITIISHLLEWLCLKARIHIWNVRIYALNNVTHMIDHPLPLGWWRMRWGWLHEQVSFCKFIYRYGHQRRINEIPQHACDTLGLDDLSKVEIKRHPYMSVWLIEYSESGRRQLGAEYLDAAVDL